MDGWPFEAPENVATLTTRQVVKDGDPILIAFHYADDGMWQFSTDVAYEEADAMIVSLLEVFEIDPTIGELADLPAGWQASRRAAGQPWHRQGTE